MACADQTAANGYRRDTADAGICERGRYAAVFFYSRFYSSAAFMVLFGVGGIFAALLAYGYGINRAAEKNEGARRMLVLTLAVCALFFFFVLARIEGGEFGPAFKSYGIGLALGSLLFMKGKVDL